jgi:hypothetical protein
MVAGSATAAEFIIGLDDIPEGIQCGQAFYEGHCQMWFYPIELTDCQAAEPVEVCFIAVQPIGAFIMPARLVVNLAGFEGIETISVHVTEAFDPGCTRVMLYDGGAMSYLATSSEMGAHTIEVPASGVSFDTLVIAGWESAVWEIQISGSNLVGVDDQSFGTLKDLYR